MKRNTKLFDEIADAIEKEPKRFDQKTYYEDTTCGTSYCVAGWAAHLNGYAPSTTSSELWKQLGDTETIDIEELAAELLSLDQKEANYLFDGAWAPADPVRHNVPDALRDIGRGGDI